MYISEITVKQHLKEMQQEVQMRRLAAELQQAQHSRHWAARLFALLRHRRHQRRANQVRQVANRGDHVVMPLGVHLNWHRFNRRHHLQHSSRK
mgnify:CR=1 FL=1